MSESPPALENKSVPAPEAAEEQKQHTAMSVEPDVNPAETEGLSKKARKRLLRSKQYEANKAEKRRKEKERRKRNKKIRMEQEEKKRQELIEKGLLDEEEEKRKRIEALERGEILNKKQRREKLEKECAVAPKVVIDLAFDSDMTDKEIKSLVIQLKYCYTTNRRAEKPLNVFFCGVQGETKRLLDSREADRWVINQSETPLEKMFDTEKLVYLTAEAEDTMETYDPNKIYIIGGIVDHNRLKGVTHEKAKALGIATMRLPIDDHIKLSSRKVLTVNHVFDILSGIYCSGDWEKTFLKVLPPRKGVKRKSAE